MSEEHNNTSKMTPKLNNHDSIEPMDQDANVNEDELNAENDLEELASVNDNLDNLSSFLDAMEQRTDDIKAELMALLMSNRELRESMKQENQSEKSEQQQENATQPN